MERRKCRRCDHPMTRIITQTIEPGGSRWKACYTCLSCGHKIVAAPAGSRAEYGKSWRCWPRKPTPEQMAAAELEE